MKARPVTQNKHLLSLIALMLSLSFMGILISLPSVRTALHGTVFPLGFGFGESAPVVSEEFQELSLVSLNTAQKELPFQIPTPTWLPNGTVLRGAFVQGGWINLSYASPTPNSGLGIEIAQGAVSSNYVIPDAAKQRVTIDALPATYVQGAWNGERQWNSAADAGALSWEANGFSYRISHSGLGLTQDEVVKIAKSLR